MVSKPIDPRDYTEEEKDIAKAGGPVTEKTRARREQLKNITEEAKQDIANASSGKDPAEEQKNKEAEAQAKQIEQDRKSTRLNSSHRT